MERPQTFANTWLLLQTVGFILALEGVAEYFSDRHYHGLFRRLILICVQYFSGHDHDPTQPRLPESWEEWYNS
jgi:hypothetical protein